MYISGSAQRKKNSESWNKNEKIVFSELYNLIEKCHNQAIPNQIKLLAFDVKYWKQLKKMRRGVNFISFR